MSNRKKAWSKTKKNIVIILSLILSIVSLLITYSNELNLNLPSWKNIHNKIGLNNEISGVKDFDISVHFIDVGQGDSSLILSGENAVLIDGGERENAKTIMAYLNDFDVKSLDLVVATHPHSDHIGGLIEVIEKIPTKNVLLPYLSEKNIPTTKVYEDLLNAISNSKANVYAAVVGEKHDFGLISLRVVSPFEESSNLNNVSVCLHMAHNNSSFLFMGDAEKSAELKILNNNVNVGANVLKAGHHGSKTSSSKQFIDKVKPDYIVISCGKENKYGHPHDEVLKLYEDIRARVFRTDINGHIVFGIKNDEIQIALQNK